MLIMVISLTCLGYVVFIDVDIALTIRGRRKISFRIRMAIKTMMRVMLISGRLIYLTLCILRWPIFWSIT